MIWLRFSLLMRTSGLVAMQRAQTAAQKTHAPVPSTRHARAADGARARGPLLGPGDRYLFSQRHDGAPRPREGHRTRAFRSWSHSENTFKDGGKTHQR